MGICVSNSIRHHHGNRHNKKQSSLPSSRIDRIRSSLDLDLLAFCLTDLLVICRSPASPFQDEMRIKIVKDISSKDPICAKFSGKRKHETDTDTDVDVVSITVPAMENKTVDANADTNKYNEQSTQALNRKMSTIELCSPPKRTKCDTMLISAAELSAFYKLFGKHETKTFIHSFISIFRA